MKIKKIVALAFLAGSYTLSAQNYPEGLIDKVVAVVGGEMVMISDIEQDIQMMAAQGFS